MRRLKCLLALILLSLLLQCSSGGKDAEYEAVAQTVRDTSIKPLNAYTRLQLDSIDLERFSKKHRLAKDLSDQLRNFYNGRNYQFAWFTEDGLAEHTQAFWNLHLQYLDLQKDSSIYHQQLHRNMDSLLQAPAVWVPDSTQVKELELLLTQHFFEFAALAYKGRIDPKDMQWFIPRKKLDAINLLDSLIKTKGEDLENWEPLNPRYKLLKDALVHYYKLEKGGGWTPVTLVGKKLLRVGDSSVTVTQLKRRMRAEGIFKSDDTAAVFTSQLEEAVRDAQHHYGLKEDGVVGSAFLQALNVPLEQRIEQILINLERMRWLPADQSGERIVVNIPAFQLHVLDGSRRVMSIDIVVGKAAHKTVIFSNRLRYIVFSPYWNVPPSIVRNELLPAMRRNPGYLRRNNMEITGYAGGLPVIRQKPGPSNSLGLVKFLFPNEYNIYFHDTPAKSLFSNEQRAFSHGCIRLSKPVELAQYLLRNETGWSQEAIYDAMHQSQEKWVTLRQPIPVFISYFTAWADPDGKVHFRNDIYGHDVRMSKRLFIHESHRSASNGTEVNF